MIDNLERNGIPLPDWYVNRPEVPPHQYGTWDAFQMLSGSRQMGMGPGPIPLTEIEAYFRLTNVHDPDDVDEYLKLIREMDQEYLKAQSEQQDKKS